MMRNLLVGLVLLAAAPVACGDSSSDDGGGDDNEAGAGGSSGNGTGGSTTGGSTMGGSTAGGASGTGGTPTGGTGGDAGGDATGGTGGEDDGGDGGMGGDPGPGGTGGMAGGAMGGMAGTGTAGGGSGGKAGGGAGGKAGGGAGGAGTAGGGSGGKAGGGAGGAGTAGGGSGGKAGGGAGVPETACSDGMDNDGDTFTDCADSDCALVCALGSCPSGTTPTVYSATSGLPVAIPDLTGSATVPITVPSVGVISKIAVQVGITHTYDGDLQVQLVSPRGTSSLAYRRGGTADGYAGIIFVDSATSSISTAAVPFSGSYRPDQPLAVLSGLSHSGTFGLRVSDRGSGDTGQITSFSLAMCECRGGTTCEFGPVACENGIDDDGDGLTDCQEPACSASPSCPRTEHACGDQLDNDGNGTADCADPACAFACTSLGSACTGTNRLFAYRTRDVPQTIGTGAAAPYFAPIFASSPGTVVSAALRFNATHSYVADIDLTVVSPVGTPRVLTSDNGADGVNYTNTIFIDSAATNIASGTAPFTGSFRPQDAFSGWGAQQAAGLWGADVYDDATGDGGNFTELSLGLCVAP